MADVRLTEEADQDLYAIQLYGIERFGVDQALRFQIELEKCFDLIAGNSELGRLVKTTPPTRRLIHKQYAIFYERDAEGILILALIHMSSLERLRDLEAD